MSDDTEVPVLSIGAALGDWNTETKLWDQCIVAVLRDVDALREGTVSPLNVNVVFYVEGRHLPNDWVGVRTGRFSKKDSHLLVQAAVPTCAVADRRGVLVGLLADAVQEAERFARTRGIAPSLPQLQAIVRQVAAQPAPTAADNPSNKATAPHP